MTEKHQTFSELWEKAHNGKQIPIAKKNENKKIAEEWFERGVKYAYDKIKAVIMGENNREDKNGI